MPPHHPTVSVILPVYNGAKYLESAVESILNQSYENFELLICDDGSSDETPGMVREFEQKDPRVRAICLQDNRGITFALNALIDMARGEYLARMDADDISMPNRLSVQLEEFSEHDEPLVSFAALEKIDQYGNRIGHRTPPLDDFAFHLRYGNPFVHPLLFSRTQLMRSFKYREIPYAEDYELYVRMMKAGVNFHVSKQSLLRYRVTESRIIDAEKAYAQMISRLRIRQLFRTDPASSDLTEPDNIYRQFDLQAFMKKWPAYSSCLVRYGESDWTRLLLLMKYFRFDPLVRIEVRNALRYSLAKLFR